MLQSVTKLKTSEPEDDQRHAGFPPLRSAASAPRLRRPERVRPLVARSLVGAAALAARGPLRGRSKFMQRALIAGLALVCIGAGGGTAWALTSATSRAPDDRTLPSGPAAAVRRPTAPGQRRDRAPPSGGTASAAAVARIDAATVDINSDTAGRDGQVAGTGMIITSSARCSPTTT